MSDGATVAIKKPFEGHKGGGKGGGGGGNSAPAKEAPNTLQSNTIARVVDAVSEGKIKGLVNGLKSVYFDDTPIENEDGSYNFEGVSIIEKLGTPDQSYIEGFPSVESEIGVGVEILKDIPVVRTIVDDEATSIRVKIQIPSMTSQSSTTGDLNGTSVQIRIDIRENGGDWETANLKLVSNPITISGKTTSTYETAYRVELPAGGAPWDIRVVRLSNNSTDSAQINNQTYWSTYTKIIDNKIAYVDTAVYGVEVNAKQFNQQVPARAYEIYGLEIQVPSNYDPETREYTGIWDGTLQVAWSDNPAWVLYDLLTNSRYGIGDSIDASQVDKYALYTIAQYCDELISDGQGSTEPRFTFNGVINTREEAYKVLNSIASTFTGMIYWATGLVAVSSDMPADPVKLVTPANVVEGDFNYTGSSLKSRHSVAVVKYSDPNDQYRPNVVLVEDVEAIRRYGWKAKEVTAYGCSSKSQAYRYGRWVLDNERNSTEVVTYKASFDHADLKPGDIVSIQDPTYAGIRYGGRIAVTGTSSVTLDDEVELAGGETYSLSVVMGNGEIETSNITNTSGEAHRVITLETPLTEEPKLGAMWTISGTDIAPRQFRVVSMTETEDNIFEISALLHDPNKYARVEQNLTLEDIPYSIIPTGEIKPAFGMSHEEYLYTAGPNVRSGVTISWSASPDARVAFYELEMQRPDTGYFEVIGRTSGTSLDIFDTPYGDYQFRVRAIDNLNNKSVYHTTSIEIQGLLNPPSNVTGFKISNISEQAQLSWTQVTDLDISHYVIKYTTALVDAQWGAGTVIVERIPKEATSVNVPTLVGTYMIKAVDTSGKESLNATSIVTNVKDIQQYNVVQTVTENPTFSGTKTNVQVVSSSLKLTDASQDGYYEFSNDVDLGGIFTARIIANVVANGEDSSNTIDKWLTLSGVPTLTTTDPSQWDVEIQLRRTDDDPAGSPTWSDWEAFQIGDYTGRGFQFRAKLTSINENTTPNIAELGVTLDMKDRIESDDDVLTNGSGQSVVLFDRTFKVTPAIGVSAQDMATGDYFTISSKSSSGFTVNFYDDTDTGVQRTFDWIAKGYGAED